MAVERIDVEINLGAGSAGTGESQAARQMRDLARATREAEAAERSRQETVRRGSGSGLAGRNDSLDYDPETRAATRRRNNATFDAWDAQKRAEQRSAEQEAAARYREYEKEQADLRREQESWRQQARAKEKARAQQAQSDRWSNIQQMASGHLPGRLGYAQMLAGSVAGTLGGMAHSAGHAYAVANDTTMLGGAQTRGIAEQLPVIGHLMRGLHGLADAFHQVTLKLRLSAEQHSIAMTTIAGSARAQSSYFGTRMELAGVRGKRRDYERLAGVARARYTGDVMDPMQTAHFERLQEIEVRRRSIEVELAGVGEQIEEGAGQEATLRHKSQMHERAANSWVRDANRFRAGSTWSNTMKAEVVDAERRAQQELNAQRQQEEQLAQKITHNKELAVRQEQLLLELGRQKTAVMKEELSLATQQAQMQRSFASSYGGALPGERALALQYARQARDKGFASLTPGQRSVISRVGGARGSYFVERGLEKMGDAAAGGDELSKLLGGSGETAEQLLRKQMRLQQEVNVHVEFDEAHLTASIERVMEKFVKSLDDVVVKIYEIQTAEQRRRNMESRAMQ